MDGLRRFIEADSHSAVDVGDLRRGTKSVKVKKPQFRGGHPEKELTSQRCGLTRAFINTEHIEFEWWGPPLVDADWHAFCQAIYKGIEGEEWEELCCHYRELSQATGAQSRVRVKKAKAFWAMKRLGIGVRNFMIQLAEKISWAETQNPPGSVEEHLKDPNVALSKALGRGVSPSPL